LGGMPSEVIVDYGIRDEGQFCQTIADALI
jgi:hypothetical protein